MTDTRQGIVLPEGVTYRCTCPDNSGFREANEWSPTSMSRQQSLQFRPAGQQVCKHIMAVMRGIGDLTNIPTDIPASPALGITRVDGAKIATYGMKRSV